MSVNRVQKLLFSEYCDFDDMVLIESPFAQTTKDGKGLRQVHLGLTPTKLILATDLLPPVELGCVSYRPNIDPEIETFELIAIYPVECVNLTIYRRRKRQALKARFCNNRVLYFELGGFEKRGMFWNLWCEKVKFLCPGESEYSRSETSVGTSTTASSLYLVDKKIVLINGIKQLWYRFGPNLGINTNYINNVLLNNSQNLATKWNDKHLFLGKEYQESPLDYKPIVKLPSKVSTKPQCESSVKTTSHPSLMEEKHLSYGDNVLVNRFGSGINEGCETGLYLTLDEYILPTTFNLVHPESSSLVEPSNRHIDFEQLAETAVLAWEYYSFRNCPRVRHRRRYGFAPKPLFMFGIGLWDVTKGEAYSLQIKRTCSEVYLACLSETNLKLSIPKQQLFSTISSPDLRGTETYKNNRNTSRKSPTIFWTPGYSYRPISARDIYFNLQNILKKIRYSQESKTKRKRRRCNNRRFLKKRTKNKDTDEEDEDDFCYKKSRKYNFIVNMLAPRIEDAMTLDNNRRSDETPLQHIKRTLKTEVMMSAWNFDSTTFAEQLTLIDRELFLKIPSVELGLILYQRQSGYAPNIKAAIAFSNRISCLISTEILKNDSEKVRARLVARFINVANKCHRISNFQSCRSVLGGLQNPAIYRLRKTWAYVRKKHSSKYQSFEFLCRLYRDPSRLLYPKTFITFSQTSPCIPYIGHLISTLLNKISHYKRGVANAYSVKQLKSTPISNRSYTTFYCEKPTNLEIRQTIFSKIFDVFVKPSPHIGPEGDRIRTVSVAEKLKENRKKNQSEIREDVNSTHYTEHIRRQILIQVTELLEKCQVRAMNYNYTYDETSRNFLLKARYFEDKDNFLKSLRME